MSDTEDPRLPPNRASTHAPALPSGRRPFAGRDPSQTTLVFLHIPKTAGQTIHAELTRVVGADAVSPIRVHTEADPGMAQMPPGYRLYSGHIDWEALETLPAPRFTFTVLRDPLERIASFYFYTRREAQKLSAGELTKPHRVGMARALSESADDYFFGGPPRWRRFVREHYHSPYCAYLITRRIRGFAEVADWPAQRLVREAVDVARSLDGVYSVDGLGALEQDLSTKLGLEIAVTGRFMNASPEARSAARWPQLAALLSEDSIARLHKFARADQMLMYRLGLGPKPKGAK